MKKSILTILIVALGVLKTSGQENRENEKRQGPPTIKKIFKDLDTNEDGKISLKEAKGPLKQDFKKIDTNKDGFISKEELKKAPKPKRPERPERREDN
ncbi:EF-hand domain-containing protein [Polaribacter sp. P097]|uniref:EF-hand domain-containing protein n=1 Tax=Polaribacter sp. P097 TaxID=3117398 RepID=UPI002FE2A2F9